MSQRKTIEELLTPTCNRSYDDLLDNLEIVRERIENQNFSLKTQGIMNNSYVPIQFLNEETIEEIEYFARQFGLESRQEMSQRMLVISGRTNKQEQMSLKRKIADIVLDSKLGEDLFYDYTQYPEVFRSREKKLYFGDSKNKIQKEARECFQYELAGFGLVIDDHIAYGFEELEMDYTRTSDRLELYSMLNDSLTKKFFEFTLFNGMNPIIIGRGEKPFSTSKQYMSLNSVSED